MWNLAWSFLKQHIELQTKGTETFRGKIGQPGRKHHFSTPPYLFFMTACVVQEAAKAEVFLNQPTPNMSPEHNQVDGSQAEKHLPRKELGSELAQIRR